MQKVCKELTLAVLPLYIGLVRSSVTLAAHTSELEAIRREIDEEKGAGSYSHWR